MLAKAHACNCSDVLPCLAPLPTSLMLGSELHNSPTPRLEGEDIVAEVVTEYAGREIGRERRPLHGALLREALASLILSGSLFPGVGEQLTRAIDAWQLRCALTPDVAAAETADVTPHTWLVSRLALLGVEVAEEYQLLSP